MATVDICNQALAFMGERGAITSLSEGTREAKVCGIHYEPCRRETLVAVSWPFARKSLPLALLGAAAGTPENLDGTGALPEPNWLYTYAYPADCLKPIWISPSTDGDITTPWSNIGNERDAQNNLIYFVEGIRTLTTGEYTRVISANKSAAVLLFIANVTNSDLFPPDFSMILAKMLAAKITMSLSGDARIAAALTQEATTYLGRAYAQYAAEYEKDKRPVVFDPMPESFQARFSPFSSKTYPYPIMS